MAVPVRIKVFVGGALIGSHRKARVDLALVDNGVTRLHCAITTRADGTLSRRDLGGSWGTFLNGKRIEESPLYVSGTAQRDEPMETNPGRGWRDRRGLMRKNQLCILAAQKTHKLYQCP